MISIDFVSVPVIVAVVVGLLEIIKKAVRGSDKVLRFFPLIAACVGAALGIIAFFAMPEIIPAGNAFLAIIIGGSSGLAATGTHQVFKQLLPKADSKEEGKADGGGDDKK